VTDGDSYAVNQFSVLESAGEWKTTHRVSRFRALSRRELTDAIAQAGLSEVRWHEPEESGFYQPIVTARKRG
jgi:hypothetical protein